MKVLARVGWLACGGFFAVLVSSVFRIHSVGINAELFLVAVAVVAIVRPALALGMLALLMPVIGLFGSVRWNNTVAWPEVLACAVLAGLSVNAAYAMRRTPPAVGAPAAILVCVVIASVVASLGVVAVRLGPAFTHAIVAHFTREHFVELRGFPTVTTGLRLLEGVLLCVLAARLSMSAGALRRVIGATVAGAAIAGSMNIARLFQAAARSGDFWSALIDLSQRLRWNVHYGDLNAAGSYFVLALLFAAGLATTSGGAKRIVWTACAIVIGGALWLTSARVAFLAGALAATAAMVLPHLVGRARIARAAAVVVVGGALLVWLAIALPQREGQVSAVVATDVRIGMAQTGARMIASHPVFGIGLGEFSQRSGEFSSPELIAKLPGAVHENAHNNFIQIAAELGLTGGVVFIWLIVAALFASNQPLAGGEPGSQRWHALAVAGVGAFVLTWLGGHPLLVPEPAFVFWVTLGALAGASASAGPAGGRQRWWAGIACILLFATLPWRMQAMLRGADFEHVGIGVSALFRTAPDGVRYRDAQGHATLFVPVGAFKFSVNPRSTTPVRLELRLDHRIADVVMLAPNVWTDVSLPARTERAASRYAQLDLRVVDNDETIIWITKVQPIQ